MPVLFTRIGDEISWKHVFKIWQDQALLIPLFILNHWLLVPRFLLKKKHLLYFISVLLLIAGFVIAYYLKDEIFHKNPQIAINLIVKRPQPIPPYAHLLMYSLLIVGVDAGLLFFRRWDEMEKEQERLEKENLKMQLNILQNQISPHFFMNTLNNIYALIEHDTKRAKEVVMQFSKLMRYMLYENGSNAIMLSKEFELIKSYISLMKIRYASEVNVNLFIPETFTDVEVPPMIFISYIENAFKYGTSYEQKSEIDISFIITDKELSFSCQNTIFNESQIHKGGLGNKNIDERLKLLFGAKHELNILTENNQYKVTLKIPLS
jgi:hypothetical protein